MIYKTGDNMNLEEIIYKRQSIRKYESTPLSEDFLDDLRNFIENAQTLNPDIGWTYDIVDSSKVKTLQNFHAPHHLLIFSENRDNYLENIGFIFQQVDLYLQANGFGSCWVGAGGPKDYEIPTNQEFVILITFGKAKGNLYRDKSQFKRKSLDKISDYEDERLIPAQLAPSAGNSQGWYFRHNDDGTYDLYRNKRKLVLKKSWDAWNYVDMGIALAHLYVSNRDSFKFYIKEKAEDLKNKIYIGSFEI